MECSFAIQAFNCRGNAPNRNNPECIMIPIDRSHNRSVRTENHLRQHLIRLRAQVQNEGASIYGTRHPAAACNPLE